MKIDKNWLDTHDWMLRSSNKGTAYQGFKWNRKGVWTKSEKWDSSPTCGNGLHGNAPEAHGYGFDYGTLELVETRGGRVVVDNDKIKVPEARIVACNAEIPAEAFERCGMNFITKDCTITPKPGEIYVVIGCTVSVDGQQGGYLRAYGNSTVNSDGQQGGYLEAYGNSTVNSDGQQGGYLEAYGNSTVNRR